MEVILYNGVNKFTHYPSGENIVRKSSNNSPPNYGWDMAEKKAFFKKFHELRVYNCESILQTSANTEIASVSYFLNMLYAEPSVAVERLITEPYRTQSGGEW